MHKSKGSGLVRDIFTDKKIARLKGNIGIAHNRYPTHGGFSHGEIQPFWTSVPYGIALAHNGNLTNYNELAKTITSNESRYLNTQSDSEVLLHLFADLLHNKQQPNDDDEFFSNLCCAMEKVFKKVHGAYSVVALIIGKGIVAFRDPNGIRPLVKGVRTNKDGKKDHIVASENTMFYPLGFEPERSILPGEIVYINQKGRVFNKRLVKQSFNPCIFEYVYFARPDATLNDVSVYRSRLRMGQNLAEKWKERFPNKIPDIIIPAISELQYS